MSFSVDVLANIAIELQRGIGHQDRFQRLITTLRQVLEVMRLRCYVTIRGSLFRLPSTVWQRMFGRRFALEQSTAGSDCPRG